MKNQYKYLLKGHSFVYYNRENKNYTDIEQILKITKLLCCRGLFEERRHQVRFPEFSPKLPRSSQHTVKYSISNDLVDSIVLTLNL